jgi:hypothetical protein
MSDSDLGKLQSVHGIAPAYLQRAVIVAVLSFVFFLVMLVAFSIRQNFGYFLLSTAFLIVYLFTMFGWLMLRKNIVKIYENGLSYKNFTARWDEIETVETKRTTGAKINCEISRATGEKVVLSEAISDIEYVIRIIERKSDSEV